MPATVPWWRWVWLTVAVVLMALAAIFQYQHIEAPTLLFYLGSIAFVIAHYP